MLIRIMSRAAGIEHGSGSALSLSLCLIGVSHSLRGHGARAQRGPPSRAHSDRNRPAAHHRARVKGSPPMNAGNIQMLRRAPPANFQV